MKKSLGLLLVAALLLGVFVYASDSMSSDTDASDISLCLIVPTEFGDKSFNDSAKEGVDKLKDEYGIKTSTVECKGVGYKQSLTTAAEKNNIVVAVGWEFSDIKAVAEEYPGTNFLWVDNVVDQVETSPNILCITYRQNEGGFLAGYIAARLSQMNAIGAVGGADDENVNDFMVGYEQGAKYANDGISVYTNYVGDYENIEMGKTCAEELNAKGADVIFQIAGNAGNGVFQAAKEKGFYAIGVDQDQKISASEFDDVIVCSVKKEIGGAIYDAVSDFVGGEEWNGGTNEVYGIAEGYISIVYGSDESEQQVTDDIKSEVEELALKIANGTIEVDSYEPDDEE